MRTIYKYAIEVGTNHVEMPSGAVIRHVAEQHDQLCVWAMVNTTAPKSVRRIRVLGTGHDLAGATDYIGSVHIGAFVWHAFDLGEA